VDIEHYLKKEGGAEKLEMKVRVDNQEFVASLLDLPTISETYRTVDRINLFKSNDVSQMIYVHKPEEHEVP